MSTKLQACSHWQRWVMRIFPGRLISRYGGTKWPPRSPDLSAPDFSSEATWRPKCETRPASILDLRPWIQHHVQAAPNNFLQRIMQELDAVMKVSWNMSYFLALMVAVLHCIVHVSIISMDRLNPFIHNSLQKPPGISAPLSILPNCIQANFALYFNPLLPEIRWSNSKVVPSHSKKAYVQWRYSAAHSYPPH